MLFLYTEMTNTEDISKQMQPDLQKGTISVKTFVACFVKKLLKQIKNSFPFI